MPTGNTQQVINYGATANDGQGDPLRTAFIKTDDNFDNIWLAGPAGSNVRITNNTIGVLDTNGNLILSPNGIGIVQTNNHIVPRFNKTYDLGSANLQFRNVYVQAFSIGTDITTTGNVTANAFIGDGSQLTGISVGNNGAVQVNWQGSLSSQGGTPDDTYSTLQFDSNGMPTLDGTDAYQQRVDYSPYLQVLAPEVESTDFDVVAGPGITVVGYDDNYNIPRSAYLSVQDQATATQQWDFGILGNGSNAFSIRNRTASTIPLVISTDGTVTASTIITNDISSDDSSFVTIQDGLNVIGDIETRGNVTADYFYGDGSQLLNIPVGNNGAVQVAWLGKFSSQGGTPDDTYSTLQFDSNGMPTLDGTSAYQQRVDYSPYLQVLAPEVESTDYDIVAGPGITVVGYDDNYNTPRSAYLSVQDQANATQQWDFGILGNGSNNFSIQDRTGNQVWSFGTDGNINIPGLAFNINYANSESATLSPSVGNSGAVQFNWQGSLSNQGGTPGDTYSTMQFDSDGLLNVNGTTAYQPRVDYTPYVTVNTPRVESTDFDVVAGPGITVVGYDDNYNIPRSAYMSVQDQANATQQWDFGILGNGSNAFSVRNRTASTIPLVISTDGYLIADGSQLLNIPVGNNGAVQVAWLGKFSNQGGTPDDTYSTLQFDSNGMPTLDGTDAYQQRVDYSPYLQVLAPEVESTDFDIVAGPGITVVGYDDNYNIPRSAYMSVQDQANATQQWDFGILGNGSNNYSIRDRTNSNTWTFGITGDLSAPGNVSADNVLASAEVIASGVVQSGTGLTTGGYLSVNGTTDLHDTTVTGNLSVSVIRNNDSTIVLIEDGVDVDGNVTADYFIGDGSQLTNLPGGGNTGNVTFNDQVVVGTGTQDGSGGLYLAPGTESVGNLQYWRVRGGDVATHMHLDTGNNAYFDQYFGSDIKYVKLEAAGNVQIGSNDDTGNSAQWTFETSGNLTFPTGNLVIIPDHADLGNSAVIGSSDHNLITLSTGANGGLSSLWVEDYANASTTNIAAVYANPVPGSGIVRIAVGQNGSPGPNLWDFDASGNLSIPGNINFSGDSSAAPSLNDFFSITSAANFAIVTDNANTDKTWNFDSTGNLTLPANTFAVNYANGTQVSLGGGSNTDWANIGNINNVNGPTQIAIGAYAGLTNQGLYAVAIGETAGNTSQGLYGVAVGQEAGSNIQGYGAVAVGSSAGYDTQGTQAVAIGIYAGYITQGANSVAVGQNAGHASQGINAVAIGYLAGNSSQGVYTVAIGNSAGQTSQGSESIAIGSTAGQTTQGAFSVAVGLNAGRTSQGGLAVALGYNAGLTSQGQEAVAIGYGAGQTSQATRSIIINATGSALNQTTADTFTVAPVRNDVANTGQVMFYNTTSKEITYSNVINVAGNITGGNLTVTGNITGNVATTFEGTWTVPVGTSTQSFTVTASNTYSMWVDCNIPNGILVWNATGTVTNTNVPVVGAQYAWVYTGGGTPIDFTSIPNQFVGTANAIVRSNTAPSATTNRFDFGINNTSGGNVTVRYGWAQIS